MSAHRNVGMHTDQADAEANILRALKPFDGCRRGANKSTMGYAAFPTYQFRARQGAAFSVAKIVRSLETRLLVHWSGREETRGYFITRQGQEHLASLKKD